MFGSGAQERAFLAYNEAASYADFVTHLKAAAIQRGTIDVQAIELHLGDYGCQFGESNGEIITLYYRKGVMNTVFPRPPEVLRDLRYHASVQGKGTDQDPFYIEWDGMSPQQLARSVVEDFSDFVADQQEAEHET